MENNHIQQMPADIDPLAEFDRLSLDLQRELVHLFIEDPTHPPLHFFRPSEALDALLSERHCRVAVQRAIARAQEACSHYFDKRRREGSHGHN